MSRASAPARVSSTSAAPAPDDLSLLPLLDVRSRRRQARAQLELVQLRGRQSPSTREGHITRLKEYVDRLTNELISRYERDPDLIDEILADGPGEREARP
jgi:hypothetical protein